MDAKIQRIDEVRPRLIRRATGGWLAVSPDWARFLIGITADTESEAIDQFRASYARWVSIADDTVQEST